MPRAGCGRAPGLEAKIHPVQLKLKLTRWRLSLWWDVGEPGLRFWETKAELLGLEVPKNNLAPLLLAAVSASAQRGAWECGCWKHVARFASFLL